MSGNAEYQERTRSALQFLSSDCDRETWVKYGMCIKSALGEDGFELWDAWSSLSDKYKASDARSTWKSIKAEGRRTIASLFYDAKQSGWTDQTAFKKATKAEIDQRKAEATKRAAQADDEEAARHEAAAAWAQQLWDEAAPCESHAYLERKGVKSHGLRVGDWKRIDPDTGEVITTITGGLLIPIRDRQRKLWSLQCIPANPDRKKLYLRDGVKRGNFHSVGQKPLEHCGRRVFVLAEGYATAASVHEATGHLVICCFDVSNLGAVALSLRQHQADAIIIFAADNDADVKENPGVSAAKKISKEVAGLIVIPPAGDFNDLYLSQGAEAVSLNFSQALDADGPANTDIPDLPSVVDLSNRSTDLIEVGASLQQLDTEFASTGLIPLGRFGNAFVFWRTDLDLCEILTASELGTRSGLHRLASLDLWESAFGGDLQTKQVSSLAINACMKIGDVEISLVPGYACDPEAVRSKFGYAQIRAGISTPALIAQLLHEAERWSRALYMNELTGLPMASLSPPCGGEPGAWTDAHDLFLARHISQHFGIDASSKLAHEVANVLAEMNRKNPVVMYLNELAWDGVPRLENWLIDLAEAPDSPYMRAVSRRVLISAVARARKPGCKVDTAMVLEGGQGAGKSSFLRALVPEAAWFAEDLGGAIGGKDALQGLSGKWIVELAELASVKKSNVDEVKSFLSRQIDTYRPSYARRAVDHPRRCIFFGTVNPDADGRWLHDSTGGRRFWPVPVINCDVDGLLGVRDQLWAEADALFRAGEQHWLSSTEETLAAIEQDCRVEANVWDEHVSTYLDKSPLCGEVSASMIYKSVTGREMTRRESEEGRGISNALRSRGWRQRRSAKTRTRVWVPPPEHGPL